ncbi:transketolase family protein [Peptococcus simiae]|uniref:transketolase family protein n=1 Tax=Peptococcus simiae TaxID=1643805 RepID=UPI00397F8A03
MDKQATRDAYGKALADLGHIREDIVVLDADLSGSTKTALFAKDFPDRFFNMGIAEQNMIGTAAGLAASGYTPFASTFAVFACGRAYDQIRNSVCYPNLPVKICASHAGLTVGEDGGSHQMIEDLALMRVLPNMTVLVPADGPETAQAVIAAADHPGPVYMRLGRPKVPVITDTADPFVIGKAGVLREGIDVTLVACGIMVAQALEAADLLADRGISATVLNMATIKPLDKEALVHWAETTGAIVTAEEHNVLGGLGGAVAETLGQACPVPLEMVGIQDQFGQSGSPAALLEAYGLTPQAIADAAARAIDRKN